MKRACRVAILLIALAACRKDHSPPTLPPPLPTPIPPPQWVCPEMAAGDYFWRGGVGHYPPYFKQVRVFWRQGIPVVPCVSRGILGIPWECVPTRYVIVHLYGGCEARDEDCMLTVLEELRRAGVGYVEIANEQGTECRSCLAVQLKVTRRAREMGFIIYANVEPVDLDGWDILQRDWLPIADRLALHGRLPRDVDTIPGWLLLIAPQWD